MPVSEGSPINVPANNNVLQTFADATAGRSIFTYYVSGFTDSVGGGRFLSRDPVTCRPTSFSGGGPYTADIIINKPTIFNGIAYITFKFGWDGGVGASTYKLNFDICKWNGSETVLASVESENLSAAVATLYPSIVKVNFPKTLFKIGEYLRLKFLPTATGAMTARTYHDNLTAGNEMKLYMPVVNME